MEKKHQVAEMFGGREKESTDEDRLRNVSKTNKWQKKNLPKFSEYFS